MNDQKPIMNEPQESDLNKSTNEQESSNIDSSASDNPQEDTLKDIKMVKCRKCGEETPESVRYCMHCGYDQVEKPYVSMDKKKAKMIRWIIGIPLVIAFLIWFILFYIN